MKQCARCKSEFPLADFPLRLVARKVGSVRVPHSWCTACRSASTRRAPSHAPKMSYPIWVRSCAMCGREFTARFGFQVTCGPSCRDALRQEKDRTASAARHANARGSKITPRSIFERDGWTCHICGSQTDSTTASLDHLVPVAWGGEHTRENLKTAHRRCNSRRGATVRRRQVVA